MIRHIIENVKWGVDPVQAPDGQSGVQINLFDEQSQHVYHVPFGGDSLKALVIALAEHLNENQRREVAPVLNGGIYVPGRDFDPTNIKPGPQG